MHMNRMLLSLAASLGLSSSLAVSQLPIMPEMMPNHAYRNRGAAKRRKTGALYPHSSTRQRARYARQIAAGQIKNA